MLLLAVAFAYAGASQMAVTERWFGRPELFLCPLAGLGAAVALLRSVRLGQSLRPFLWAVGLFLTGFLTLAISFYPYMIPYSVTIRAAAAPPSSQAFLLWAGAIVLPVILAYTCMVYWIFRGKVAGEGTYH